MNKVYIVEAHFEDPESSWWSMIGLFTDINKAEESSEKWNNFFTENEKIFDTPQGYQTEYYTSCYGDDSTNWYDSNEYYELKSDFRDIKYFTDITIREFDLDKEIFVENVKSYGSDKMLNLMNQWGRDYKINELIK